MGRLVKKYKICGKIRIMSAMFTLFLFIKILKKFY